MPGHHFISYSSLDALEFALKLRTELESGPPSIPVWLDKRDIQPEQDWDESLADALKTCDSLLFVMTRDSVEDESVCKQEWTYALRYKKPVIPIKLHPDAEMPFRLAPRQHIDFTRALDSTAAFNQALAKLRKHLEWRASPEGVLQALRDRLADAQRDLRRDRDTTETARIQQEITLLNRQIAEHQRIIDDPQAAAQRTQESIERGLERERQPEKPVSGAVRSASYVPNFKHDIFISYAHVDNVPLVAFEEGWVTNFHADLKHSLARIMGRFEIFDIWMDPKLRGNDELNPTIETALGNSAVMVSIMSPAYLASAWCLKELQVFWSTAHPHLRPAAEIYSRVFTVLLSYVAREDLPEQMRDDVGYMFFERDLDTEREHPYRRTGADDPDQRYWRTLESLARDIAKRLTQMDDAPMPPPEPIPAQDWPRYR